MTTTIAPQRPSSYTSNVIDQARTQHVDVQMPAGHIRADDVDLSPHLTQATPPSLERSLDARRAVAEGDLRTQHLQSTLAAPGDTPDANAVAAQTGANGPKLRSGYASLETLSHVLPRKDPRFNPATPKGRAAMVLALAIGGTEVHGRNTDRTDFFTRRGGTGNNMLGFAQFNLAYHRGATNTPEKYTKLVGDMLTGVKPLPNNKAQADFASRLVQAVDSGKVNNGATLERWMRANGFGGSNWQGIDDGWKRVPGLGDDLVKFLRSARPQSSTVNV